MRFDRALRVDIPQVLRALDYGGTGPGAQVGAQLAQAALQIERCADAHWTFRPFALEAPPRLPEAQLSLPGRDIALHLAGCGACLLLAVTLGGGIERHIRAAGACDMAAALLLDVAASTLAEQYADEAERLLRLQYEGQSAHLTGRFSPGYGDLPLALQGDLLRLLNAQRQIGLTVSAGGILLPRKSITALLGVADRPVSGRPAGCETCALRARCARAAPTEKRGDTVATTSIFNPDRFTILDGGMGTMLQAAGLAPGACPEQFNLRAPDKLCDIQRAYVEAGADILLTNTFGASARKLQGTGISVAQAVSAGIACARRAADGRALVALDIGPLGELLEPNGTLTFEQAYGLFAEVVRAGKGADLVLIETMADLYEVKAAVLAALECCDLPVLVSMTFEQQGRSFAGVSVEGFATAIGALPVAGLGINCSLGPAEVMPLLRRLCAATELPVFAMPNAGLPNPVTGAHDLSPEAFCAAMAPCLDMGVAAVGGCCGTTPATIALLSKQFKDRRPAPRRPDLPARVCGSTHVAEISRPLAVGERINPTGKKRLREALQAGDLSLVQTLAVEQQQAGAEILDVNVGAPGVDEVRLLPRAVKAVQAVSGLPLQIDSSDPAALEAALRVCCGKPIVNSTSAEEDKLQAILPLCRRYGAAVVGLTLDEAGVPERAEARVALAQKIVDRALAAGLPKRDLYIDCLTLSVGAQPEAAAETLRALRAVKQQLGVKAVLGVSNVSFGLPDRPLLNRTFLAMALAAGLDLAIVNPSDGELMDTLSAHRLLAGHEGAADAYVARRGGQAARPQAPAPGAQGLPLDLAIERGLRAEAAEAARALLQSPGADPLALVGDYLIPALDRVGEGFEQKTVFLPQLLMAAGAAQAAFEVIRAGMGAAGLPTGPTVVVATVQGDIHDIGKNIARALLENYGFAVIDLGRDVPPEAVVEAAEQSGAALVGLSALMTTTLPAMERTIALLRQRLPDCRILVGGAVLNEAYAKQIGADFFARDAKASADYARSLTK